jgi:hypothetical protein
MDLQVHPKVVLHLRGVKVQDLEMYQLILGTDVLSGAHGLLEGTGVFSGSHVMWKMADGTKYETKVLNQKGPAGRPAVMAAVPPRAAPTVSAHTHPAAGGGTAPPAPAARTATPGTTAAQQPPGGGSRYPPPWTGPSLLEIESPLMTREQLAQLHELAEER